MTLAELLAQDDVSAEAEVPRIGRLPPLFAPKVLPRASRVLPIPDLTRSARVWLLIGEGNLGKTLVARWLADEMRSREVLADSVMAAVAPGNRNLERFVDSVMQPPGTDPRETAEWTLKLLLGMARERLNGVIDGGGGDTSTGELIRTAPDLAQRTEESGLALVAAYFLGPRVDDLVYLAEYESQGFRPKATALVLNLARAETPGAFDDIRRQPVYKAALDRGAVELWLPALPQDVALAIERKCLHFGQAQDGRVPEGRTVQPLGMMQRTRVRNWRAEMAEEMERVRSWLPWESP